MEFLLVIGHRFTRMARERAKEIGCLVIWLVNGCSMMVKDGPDNLELQCWSQEWFGTTVGYTRRVTRSLPWEQDTLNGWEVGYDPNGAEVERIPWKSGQKEGIALQYAVDENAERRIVRRMGYREDLLRWVEDINRYDDQGRQTGKWMTFWPNERVRKEGPTSEVFKKGSLNSSIEMVTWSAQRLTKGVSVSWMLQNRWLWIYVSPITPMAK